MRYAFLRVLKFSLLLRGFAFRFLFFFLTSHVVRHEVCASVRNLIFTVAILAQGTNRGDALCAALLSNRDVSILYEDIFFKVCFLTENLTQKFFFLWSKTISIKLISNASNWVRPPAGNTWKQRGNEAKEEDKKNHSPRVV